MPFVSVIAASVSAFPSLSRVVDHDNDQNQKSDTVQAKQNIEQCGEKYWRVYGSSTEAPSGSV